MRSSHLPSISSGSSPGQREIY